MRSAVDTNVLSAVWDQEPTAMRLTRLLGDARRQGSLVLCAAVFAETLAHPRANEAFIRKFLTDTDITVDFDLEERVWLEAGRRYARFAERRRHSSKEQPKRMLADFVIGAHALLTADRLITLDRRRYSRDFPTLVLA